MLAGMRFEVRSTQIAATLILLALAGLLSIDLFTAIGAHPCPGGAGCYPWGAEGPSAGLWSYASKTNYLIRGFSQLAILLATGLYLIWRAWPERLSSGSRRIGVAIALAAFVALYFV